MGFALFSFFQGVTAATHARNWPRQMVPIKYKQRWERREKLRYAFRKHGYELDVPKLGG